MARYNTIRKIDVANGDGVNTSIFFQGCPHQCEGCFNPETWDRSGGEMLTKDVIKQLYDYTNKDYVHGLTMLGGEPLALYNIKTAITIAKMIKNIDKEVRVYTGYTLEELSAEQRKILPFVDVLIDGKFIKDLKVEDEKVGSSNQRILYKGVDY